MSKYKWSHPAEWLNHKIDDSKEASFAVTELASMCRLLASKLDGDTIQDLFQDEMDEDGYFQELPRGERTAAK